jgi:DUF438 domain-containing protein
VRDDTDEDIVNFLSKKCFARVLSVRGRRVKTCSIIKAAKAVVSYTVLPARHI